MAESCPICGVKEGADHADDCTMIFCELCQDHTEHEDAGPYDLPTCCNELLGEGAHRACDRCLQPVTNEAMECSECRSTVCPDCQKGHQCRTCWHELEEQEIHHKQDVAHALDMARAFVGMHTGDGVPAELMGRFEEELANPKLIMEALELAKGNE